MKARLLLLLVLGLMLSKTILAQGNDNPTGPAGSYNGEITTGGMYDPYTGNVKRVLTDMVVPGCIGAYPLKVTRYYNSRGNSSGGWTIWPTWGYNWYTGVVTAPDGRTLDFIDGLVGVQEYMDSQAPILYLPDGGKVTFAPYYTDSGGTTYYRQTLLTDPYGLATTYSYSSNIPGDKNTVLTVTEPGGKYIVYSSVLDGSQYITDSYAQAYDVSGNLLDTVHYVYSPWTGPNHNLVGIRTITQVVYNDGTVANYTYKPDNVQNKWPLLGTCDDVRFGGPMRQIEYDYKPVIYDPSSPDPLAAIGAIKRERRFIANQSDTGEILSSLGDPNNTNQVVETRGDGSTRTFTYTGQASGVPGRLKSYTDFQGQLTQLFYDDPNFGGFLNRVTDANNHSVSYSRGNSTGNNWSAQITGITYPDTNSVSYGYTDATCHYLASKTDERSNVTYFDRDGLNRIYQTRYPDGSTEYFWYNSLNQVTQHRLKNGAYEYFAYDPSTHLLTDQWNPTTTTPLNQSEPHVHFDYYTGSSPWSGRLMKKTWPANANGLIATEIYEYDRVYANGVMNTAGAACAGRGLATKVTFADGNSKTLSYDFYGSKLSETNELNQTTNYVYDLYKRPLSVSDPLGHMAQYSYQDIFGSTLSPYAHNTSCVRDMTDPAGVVTRSTYDTNCRKLSVTAAYGTSLAATSSTTYDPVGNVLSATDPLGHTTTMVYDNRDRKVTLTNALNQQMTFQYDAASNPTWSSRTDGTWAWKDYDSMNRVAAEHEQVDGSSNRSTWFSYEAPGSGLLSTVTDDNNNVTRFSYDASGRKTQMTYPNNDHQQWTYDDVGHVRIRWSVNGTYQVFGYDNRNRNTTMDWSNYIDYARFGYDAAGRMTTANNGNSSITRAYDAAGRLTDDTQNIPQNGTMPVHYAYDQNGNSGRLTELTIGGGYDARYSYDAMGRLQYIGDQWRGNTVQYSYDAANDVTQRYTILNNSLINYSYDTLNRMSTRYVWNNGTGVSYETYGYDNRSRLGTVQRSEDGKLDAFGYDYSNQMTAVSYGWNWNGTGWVNPSRSLNYALDLAGNRNQVTDSATGTVTYQHNNLNEYNYAPDPIYYDPFHSIAAYKGIGYNYINDGRLTSVSGNGNSYNIKYDALGRTISRTLNGATTYYYYDGEKAILEQGATSASNLYGLGIDEIVIRFEPTDVKYFYQDHEGSVTHVANLSGGVVESYRYDAFGQPTMYNSGGQVITSGISAINNRFMFTGREWAPVNLGFYEYRARAYHPGLGRFMSEDPKGFAAGDYNLYRYCGNDPVDHTDPSGTIIVAGGYQLGSWATQATIGNGAENGSGANSPGGSSPKADQAGGGSDAARTENYTSGYISGEAAGEFTVTGSPRSATGTVFGASASVITTKYTNSEGGYKTYNLKTEMHTGTIDQKSNIHWDTPMHNDTPVNGLKPATITHQTNGVTRVDAAGRLITGSRRPGSNIVDRNASKAVREFRPFIQEFRVSAWGSNGKIEDYLGSITYSAAYDQHRAPVYTGFGEHIPAGF